MTNTSNPSNNIKKNQFNIVINPEIYANAEKHGYISSVFDGEEIKGNVEIQLKKPEMVKCIRLQLIGYISKGSKLTTSEILKYINNESKILISKLKKYTNDSNNKNQVNTTTQNSNSKYDNLTVLVDYDVILWGKYSNKKRKSKDNDLSNTNRKELINQDFTATRLNCEQLKLPFIFKLFNKNNKKNEPLPSSFNGGKCTVAYFLYATINKPWPKKNSTRIMYLRVLQKVKVDIPKYLAPIAISRQKELKFLKCIKKGIIEMNANLPKRAYCHRENIPINIKINHMGMNKTIFGLSVGLYERCYYKDIFEPLSLKLLFERFYEFKVKPGETDKETTLNFPLVDGNCYIDNKILQMVSHISHSNVNINNCVGNSNSGIKIVGSNNDNSVNSGAVDIEASTCSSSSSSNSFLKAELGYSNNMNNNNDESMALEYNDEINEEDVIKIEKEEDKTRIKLSNAKVGCISVTIDNEKWPLKVDHALRVVAITNEYMANRIMKMKNRQEKDGKLASRENNIYEEYSDEEGQIQIQITSPEQQHHHQLQSPSKSNGNINGNSNSNVNSSCNSNANSNCNSNANSNCNSNVNSNCSSKRNSLGSTNDNGNNNTLYPSIDSSVDIVKQERKSSFFGLIKNNDTDNNNQKRRKSNSFNGISLKNNEVDIFDMYELNQSLLETNKKYGILTGKLCNNNGQYPFLPKKKKILDCEFNIVIGSLSNCKRELGTESKIISEIEDQHFSTILKNSSLVNKLKLNDYFKKDIIKSQKKTRTRGFSNGNIEDFKKPTEQSRRRSFTSVSESSNKSMNKNLPILPVSNNDKSEKNYPTILSDMEIQYTEPLIYNSEKQPSAPLINNPEKQPSAPLIDNPKMQPSAPYIDDLEEVPPPYELSQISYEVTQPSYEITQPPYQLTQPPYQPIQPLYGYTQPTYEYNQPLYPILNESKSGSEENKENEINKKK